MKENPDRRERRCPRLGGDVEFSYCKIGGEDRSPCFKIFDCWWEIFDVVAHMKEIMPEERFKETVEKKPRPKVASIVEMVREIRKNTGSEG